MANAAILDGVLEASKGALVKHGAELAVGGLASRFLRGRGAGDLAVQTPTFTAGATALVAGTALFVGGWAGWALNDFLRSLKGRRR